MYCIDYLWKANGHISEECPLRIEQETIQANTGLVIRRPRSEHSAPCSRMCISATAREDPAKR